MPRLRKCPLDATFHEGDHVAIFNQTFSGCPIFEGWATIVGAGDVEDQYTIVFGGKAGHSRRFLRFVFACGQDDPIAYTKAMQAEFVERTGYDGPGLIR